MFRIAGLAALIVAVPALAAGVVAGPPGADAPRSLTGTWRATLSRETVHKETLPDAHTTWELVIVNGKYLSFKRALGLRPAGEGGDTIPFGVTGNRLYLTCLVDGAVAKGYDTYSWSSSGKALRLKLVKKTCREKLNDTILILTSQSWKRVR
jgi:hypothetical protein